MNQSKKVRCSHANPTDFHADANYRFIWIPIVLFCGRHLYQPQTIMSACSTWDFNNGDDVRRRRVVGGEIKLGKGKSQT